MGKQPTATERCYAEALRLIEVCFKEGATQLDLSRLGLTAVPPEIGNLTALTRLIIDGNQLTALPPELGNLTALTALDLNYNWLSSVPPELGNLTALTTLDLRNNCLGSLPHELMALGALERLYLHGNPNLGLPYSILGSTPFESNRGGLAARPSDILAFYFRQPAGSALQPLNEMKIMLVGDGGAGKTSLRRFFTGRPHARDEPETTGIALDTFNLRCGDTDILVRLWDFAGQEITHSLHRFFLTEDCVYIVVVEPRSDNEEDDAKKWLRLIDRYGKGAPTVVVLNKQDTRRPNGYDIDQNKLKERFTFIRGFIRTSCVSHRTSCDALRDQVRQVIAYMPEATLGVPASWIAVKEECFGHHHKAPHQQPTTERPYLSLQEFRALCAKHGETDADKQEFLARILHKLGAVLHFVEDPRLRDTAVLNPHWVTDGAYRLLRAKDGPGSDGVLTLEEAMVKSPGADEKAARYLLRLMERFEMCFPLDNDEADTLPDRWLVPGALDKNQPDAIDITQWQDPARVRLRTTYDPLPQGVLPRFIVLTRLLSEGQPRWRYGVVLRYGEARALVRRGAAENTVEVIVQGDAADRDALVKVVRGFFERVHRDLPGPPPVEAQELAGRPDVFRDVLAMIENEQVNVPLVVKEPGGALVKLDAKFELNRTTAEEPRTGHRRPLHVFVSYAHKDKRARDEFRPNLVSLKSDDYITYWDDESIDAGDQWLQEIRGQVRKMDVFVGLVTAHFRASPFIRSEEFGEALERWKAGLIKMWLILVEDVRIDGTPMKPIQVLRPDRKHVKHFGLRAGFNKVEKELHGLIEDHWRTLPERDGRGRAGGLV